MMVETKEISELTRSNRIAMLSHILSLIHIFTDLLDTLKANLDHCVGMAANMIGVKKNIIVVAAGPFQFAMINPCLLYTSVVCIILRFKQCSRS